MSAKPLCAMLDQNHGLRECFTALAPIWKAQQLPELMLSFLGSKPRACHARGDHERPTCGPTNTLQPNLLHQAAPRSSRKSSNKAARQRQHTSGMPLAGTSQEIYGRCIQGWPTLHVPHAARSQLGKGIPQLVHERLLAALLKLEGRAHEGGQLGLPQAQGMEVNEAEARAAAA
eukprot:scaffold59569_cov18-Tisochrysis_lutea.AAC.1